MTKHRRQWFRYGTILSGTDTYYLLQSWMKTQKHGANWYLQKINL